MKFGNQLIGNEIERLLRILIRRINIEKVRKIRKKKIKKVKR